MAMELFWRFAWRASQNRTRTCWVLQCDIRKFFANIDHNILLVELQGHIPDRRLLTLLQYVVESFHTEGMPGKGLPLGNLTSQLFVNIYLNPFDQWIKHHMKAQYYVRYADDFLVLSPNKTWLERLLADINNFLTQGLLLELHPDKVHLKTLASGVDFLGWVQFPDHRVLRTTTKRRMLKQVRFGACEGTIASYRGLLKHGNAHKLTCSLDNGGAEN